MIKQLLFSFLLCAIGFTSYAQQKTVSGTVTGPDGTPLPGVNVVIKESSGRGTQTDFDGAYSIEASSNEILVFSFLGFETQEQAVGSKTILNVSLTENTESLEEVVVVGYGVQRKRDLTASVSQVKGDDIANLVTKF